MTITTESRPSKRGRDATSPYSIPATGWKDILWRVYHEIGDDRIMLIAAGITFYLLLALVPALTAIVSLYGLIADLGDIQNHLEILKSVVPDAALSIIRDQLVRLTENEPAALGLATVVSVGMALWSANAGMKAIFDGMNIAYDESEKRGFFVLTAISLGFTLLTAVGTIVLFTCLVGIPAWVTEREMGSVFETLALIISYAIVLLLFSLAVACVYRWGPSRENSRWKWLSPGVVLSVLTLIVFSMLFSWYAANFGSYDGTYGSLGAMIGFMTWIWVSTIILLMGAEFNSEIEHQTAIDTTTGPERPMGERGAVMADDLGKTYDGSSEEFTRDGNSSGIGIAQQPSTVRNKPATSKEMQYLLLFVPLVLAVDWLNSKIKKSS